MVNGMNDLVFNLGDLITLGGLLVSIVGGWFKMKNDKDKIMLKIEALEVARKDADVKYKEEILAAKNSRHSIRRESHEGDKEVIELMNKRVDKLQAELKEDRENNKKEFKEINEKLGRISGDLGEIKGLLTKK